MLSFLDGGVAGGFDVLFWHAVFVIQPVCQFIPFIGNEVLEWAQDRVWGSTVLVKVQQP